MKAVYQCWQNRWRIPALTSHHGVCMTVVLVAGALTGACREQGDLGARLPADVGSQTSSSTSMVDTGRDAYATYCVGCHGRDGDGHGQAARFLSPKPTNFQTAKFKFSSTRAGRLPTDEDLRRTIREGLRGSAMPGWKLLPVETVNALIAYLKTFSPRWTQRAPASTIPMVRDPYREHLDKSHAIRRGEAVYHGFAACWACHPAYVASDRINEYLIAMENPARETFRPALEHAEAMPNADGEIVYPPDFLRDPVRAGAGLDDLYRSIAAGITGTAMPTWIDSMEHKKKGGGVLVEPADVWAMAYYVQSLIMMKPSLVTGDKLIVRRRPQRIDPLGDRATPADAPSQGDEDRGAVTEEFFEGS